MSLETLTRINTDDFLNSLGLSQMRRGRGILAWLVRPVARWFAQEVLTFDEMAGEKGLAHGAAWLLAHFSRTLTVVGGENVPRTGPLLIAANHPGMADSTALFVALNRPDLHIVAFDRPFLQALPNVSRQLILVPTDAPERLSVVRGVVQVLRAGQAVLTFPAGHIEPDPAVLPGAAESLNAWSDSVSIFARRVPDLQVVPAIVSGVVSAAALRNPLLRLRPTPAQRETMAAALQIMLPFYRRVPVRVAFGPALSASQTPNLHEAVVAEARKLIEKSRPDDKMTG